MSQELRLTPSESLEVMVDTPELLEVIATYGPEGEPPPSHFHPRQSERFEVLDGAVMTRVRGEPRELTAGETLEIPAGVHHQMWNPHQRPARLRWQTRPALRTRRWFEAVDRLHREGMVGRNGMPGPLAYAALLTEYEDVFRLGARPAALIRGLLALLAPLGRARGYLHRAP